MRARVLSALAGLLLASPAFANPVADRQLQVLGTAPSGCLMGSLSAANAANMTLAVNSTSAGSVSIAQFVDPNTLRSLPSSVELVLPITCNASHRITVSSANGGLLRGGANARNATLGGFGQFVRMNYRADWLGQTFNQQSDAGTLAIAGNGAGQGNFTLRVADPGGTGPLAAGRYADTITIEVLAAN